MRSSSRNILKINILVVFWSWFCKFVPGILSTFPRGRSRSTSVLFPRESRGVNSVLTSSQYFPVHQRARSGTITYYHYRCKRQGWKISLSLWQHVHLEKCFGHHSRSWRNYYAYFVLIRYRCVNVSNNADRTFSSFCLKTTRSRAFFFSSIPSLFWVKGSVYKGPTYG